MKCSTSTAICSDVHMFEILFYKFTDFIAKKSYFIQQLNTEQPS